MNIKITVSGKVFEAELTDSATSKAIYESLPANATINAWGNEIYFSVNAYAELENNAVTTLEVGDLAYYPPMKAFCIFFGPTPASTSDKPEAAGPVNVFGKIINPDIEALKSLRDGAEVIVEKI